MQISTYSSQFFWELLGNKSNVFEISDFLSKRNICQPNLFSGFDPHSIDTSLWNKDDFKVVRALVKTKELRTLLKSAKSRHQTKLSAIDLELRECKLLGRAIRDYSPDARLFFDDIGMVGSSLQDGWEKSTPMKLTNAIASVWELDVQLTDGFIKFRNRNGWRHNWGGSTFPEGDAIFEGKDIPVKAGLYHVEFHIEDGKYKFTKVQGSTK